MSLYNHFSCTWCGGPFNGGNCPGCSSVRSRNEFVYDPNPYSYNETPNFFNQPPQHQYETFSCEFCGGNPHPDFDCQTGNTPIYDQGPCYNQDFGFDQPPYYSPSQPQQFDCCEYCGGPHYSSDCQTRNQLVYEPNPDNNYDFSCFDPPPQYPIVHPPLYEMSLRELISYMPPSIVETANRHMQRLDEMQSEIDSLMRDLGTYTPEPLVNAIVYKERDDDIEVPFDDEQILKQHNIAQVTPPAYTPSLPFLATMEPTDTLLMGDKVISTIPARKINEFIKSSVDDLVPILKESEVTSDSNSECDMPTPLPTTHVREEDFDINLHLG
ncbi:hypothetical protein Tco_0408225 [Tanacetum coccineum]